MVDASRQQTPPHRADRFVAHVRRLKRFQIVLLACLAITAVQVYRAVKSDGLRIAAQLAVAGGDALGVTVPQAITDLAHNRWDLPGSRMTAGDGSEKPVEDPPARVSDPSPVPSSKNALPTDKGSESPGQLRAYARIFGTLGRAVFKSHRGEIPHIEPIIGPTDAADLPDELPEVDSPNVPPKDARAAATLETAILETAILDSTGPPAVVEPASETAGSED